MAPSPPPCPLPEISQFPSLNTTGCGDQVCLPTEEAERLWLWIRDVQRWVTQASVCLDNRAALPAHAKAPPTQTDTWSSVFTAQEAVIDAMKKDYPKINVTVEWYPCGQENAFYYPDKKSITLCTELAADPGMAVFAAAHEMGHAIAMQTVDDESEASADQLGALGLLAHGYQDELLGAALWFANQDHQDHYKGDPHPSARFRGWALTCLEDGWERYSAPGKVMATDCVIQYLATKTYWAQRLRL